MSKSRSKTALSARKRAAILANLAKANAIPRTRSSYARSRHNALKHGLFVRSVAQLLRDRGEDAGEYRRLQALLRRVFVPQDEREQVIVRRLAEALWRRLQVFGALARWQEEGLRRRFRALPALRRLDADRTLMRAYVLGEVLLDQKRFWRRERLVTGEVERLLRLLLRCRGVRRPREWRETRRSRAELAELSPNPNRWKRRYAAAVPLPKTVRQLAKNSDEWRVTGRRAGAGGKGGRQKSGARSQKAEEQGLGIR